MKRISLALAIAFASIQASAATPDARTPVTVSATTQQMVLEEMRGFVEGLGIIAGALAREDMAAVAAAAEPHGMRAMKKFPKPNMMEMPESFRAIGRTLHQDFDRLAADARGGGDVRQALVTVSQALAKCSGCHTAYRLQVRD